MTKQNIIYAGSLIGFFLVVVIVGRLLFFQNPSSAGPVSPSGQSAVTGQNQSGAGLSSASSLTASSSAAAAEVSTCASALAQKTEANDIQYATGTILAVFNSGLSLDQASSVLSGYGFSIEQGSNPNDTFPTYHLVTVAVPAGDEFTAICQLEADSDIHSATLNTLFSLHD
jgi:hypothetical protein